MIRPPLTFGRILWIVCGCVLLLPGLAAASSATLAIDLEGDGQRDRVVVDHGRSSVLTVWFSQSQTTQVIRTPAPILTVVASDLDGDHRPELIVRDSNLRLHIWAHGRRILRSYRPRGALPALTPGLNHRVADAEDAQPADTPASTAFAPLALVSSATPHAPALPATRVLRSGPPRAATSLAAVDPFSPRPPPSPLP